LFIVEEERETKRINPLTSTEKLGLDESKTVDEVLRQVDSRV